MFQAAEDTIIVELNRAHQDSDFEEIYANIGVNIVAAMKIVSSVFRVTYPTYSATLWKTA